MEKNEFSTLLNPYGYLNIIFSFKFLFLFLCGCGKLRNCNIDL